MWTCPLLVIIIISLAVFCYNCVDTFITFARVTEAIEFLCSQISFFFLVGGKESARVRVLELGTQLLVESQQVWMCHMLHLLPIHPKLQCNYLQNGMIPSLSSIPIRICFLMSWPLQIVTSKWSLSKVKILMVFFICFSRP